MTIGWLGNLFVLLGSWRLGYRQRLALVLLMCGDVCWMIEAHGKEMYDLLTIEVCLFCFGIRNYIKWGRSDDRANLGNDSRATDQ